VIQSDLAKKSDRIYLIVNIFACLDLNYVTEQKNRKQKQGQLSLQTLNSPGWLFLRAMVLVDEVDCVWSGKVGA